MPTVPQACDANYLAHIGDCSGFANAVAKAVGVTLTGNADAIVDVFRSEQTTPDPHGHVVVVTPGSLNRGKYPTAWWGSLGGNPGKNQTINWAWNEADRDRVSYASHDLV